MMTEAHAIKVMRGKVLQALKMLHGACEESAKVAMEYQVPLPCFIVERVCERSVGEMTVRDVFAIAMVRHADSAEAQRVKEIEGRGDGIRCYIIITMGGISRCYIFGVGVNEAAALPWGKASLERLAQMLASTRCATTILTFVHTVDECIRRLAEWQECVKTMALKNINDAADLIAEWEAEMAVERLCGEKDA